MLTRSGSCIGGRPRASRRKRSSPVGICCISRPPAACSTTSTARPPHSESRSTASACGHPVSSTATGRRPASRTRSRCILPPRRSNSPTCSRSSTKSRRSHVRSEPAHRSDGSAESPHRPAALATNRRTMGGTFVTNESPLVPSPTLRSGEDTSHHKNVKPTRSCRKAEAVKTAVGATAPLDAWLQRRSAPQPTAHRRSVLLLAVLVLLLCVLAVVLVGPSQLISNGKGGVDRTKQLAEDRTVLVTLLVTVGGIISLWYQRLRRRESARREQADRPASR